MKKGTLLLIVFATIGITFTAFATTPNRYSIIIGSNSLSASPTKAIFQTVKQDTIPLKDRTGDFINDPSTNPFDLNDPSTIKKEVEYDPETNLYIITERIGDDYFRAPTYMTFEEYLDYKAKEQQRAQFDKMAGVGQTDKSGLGIGNPLSNIDIKQSIADRLFGGTEVDIRPQGSIDLTFGFDYSKVDNPRIPPRARRNINPIDFDMDIQMNVAGSIGEKLNLNMDYNTQATFDFDNQMKLGYASDAFSEDDIIKSIELGNVSLPLQGSLITGAQSLFGVKTQLQFGRLFLTAVASQQQSEREEIQIKGGSQVQEFEVYADEYDENRHFFLSQYHRETFDDALINLPQIRSLTNIEQIEVWITNERNVTSNQEQRGPRDIIAITDLGEGNRLTSDRIRVSPTAPRDFTGEFVLPSDSLSNDIYQKILNDPRTRDIDQAARILETRFGLVQGVDFEKVNARPLREGSEYTINRELGFISINVNVQQDQVIGVSYKYKYDTEGYSVGELAFEKRRNGTDSLATPQVLFVKMLKSATPQVNVPTWDLMMKNFYNIGAYQVDRKDFKLDVYYEDPGRGQKRFLPTQPSPDSVESRQPLIRLFNLDELNVQGDPVRDGVFDFVPGLTIFPNTGRIMFPVLEPFGEYLNEAKTIDGQRDLLTDADKERFVYNELYDSTVVIAREFAEKNRFVVRGEYRSSISNEISLGTFNLPPGSVTVRAGGKILQEGLDYEVDYNIGRVRILNDAYLSSGVPVNVSFENNALFGFQTKTLIGLRADYKFNENFNVGATYLQLFERPFTQKVNIGDDPINNKIWGLDLQFSQDAPWLTRFVDKIPGIDTKAPSNISVFAEAAALQPGHARAINEEAGEDTGGIVFLDDFEGAANSINIGNQPRNWFLASVPQNDAQNGNPLFPESDLVDDLRAGANRARLNWYNLTITGLRGGTGFGSVNNINPPSGVPFNAGNPYTAIIDQRELFPNRQNTPDQQFTLQTFDMTLYPNERGPYNFDVPGGYPGISAGLGSGGQLLDPESRWGGIMYAIPGNTNFEQANIQYIEFWMLSPFLPFDLNTGDPLGAEANQVLDGREGDLYIEMGNISEDILRDGQKFFENGLPVPGVSNTRTVSTEWSNIPLQQQITTFFGSQAEEREAQDVGLDGADNQAEREKFADYINLLQQSGIANIDEIIADPSNDDFIDPLNTNVYPEGTPIIARLKALNNAEGNNPLSDDVNALTNNGTNVPDAEDLNNDQTLNETEAYFQFKVPIRRDAEGTGVALSVPDERQFDFITDVRDTIINDVQRKWYRVRIPLLDASKRKRVGGIQDFRSIRFIRMYMKGFEEPVTLRLAQFELTRSQWRIYNQRLSDEIIDFPTVVNIDAVNIEENSRRCPFYYVLPPGIRRENNVGVFNALQNEQSLLMSVEDLGDGDAKGIFKNINYDMRNYDRLRMFVHAERLGYESCGDSEEDISCDPDLEDGEVSVFIRLGSDFQENFYEYEIPLTLSDEDRARALQPAEGLSASPAYVDEIWRRENTFDFPLEWLIQSKRMRNVESDSFLLKEIDVFSTFAEGDSLRRGHKIRVNGAPNLGYVRAIMIGIRNPKDDNQSHCVEIWANELRLQGLNEQGGIAAVARIDMQLADFASVSLAGNYQSIGFGGLDQQVDQRALDELSGFDVSANLELSRFLPADWGLRLPVYGAYSTQVSKPKFSPYDKDVLLDDALSDAPNGEARDSIREISVEATEIKTVSINNAGKTRTAQGAPMPWDISNFGVSYAYTETENRDPFIEYDRIESHQGSLDYGYAIQSNPIEPFKGLPDKKWLTILRDLNFNPLPSTFTFSTSVFREKAETKYRFTDLDPKFSTFFNNQFTWDRIFGVNWDFSRALKLNFASNSYSVIDEPDEGQLRAQDFNDAQIKETVRDSIWTNITNLGRPKNYSHNLTVNFTLPTRSIPLLDWMNVRANYQADYNWMAAALNTESLGNILQNGQTRSITADFDFTKFYDKWDYLKRISTPPNTNRRSRPGRKKEGEEEKREVSKLERALIRPLLMIRRGRFTYNEDFSTLVPGFTPAPNILGMSSGFEAPGWDFVAGFQPKIRELEEQDYGTAEDWLHQISNARGADSWISDDFLLNQEVAQTYSQQIDAQLTIEPFKDFRIDVTAKRSFRENHTQTYKIPARDGNGTWVHARPRDVGSMDVSFIGLRGLFLSNENNAGIQEMVGIFERNRLVATQILGDGVHADPEIAELGYTFGYGDKQQDVILPAFLSAYTGESLNELDLQRNFGEQSLFDKMPLPNWRLSYNGLSNIPMFKEVFRSVNITHGYTSSLVINSFNTDYNHLSNPGGTFDNDFISRIAIPDIVIEEGFSPLIGVDMRLQNDLSFNLKYDKRRAVKYSRADDLMTEDQSTNWTAGLGWRIPEVEIGFLKRMVGQGKNKRGNSDTGNNRTGPLNLGGRRGASNIGDLNLTVDFSIRDNVSYNILFYNFEETSTNNNNNQGGQGPQQEVVDSGFDNVDIIATRGTNQLSFAAAAEYQVIDQLALRLFFNYDRTEPKISSSFRVVNSSGGIVVRFTLN